MSTILTTFSPYQVVISGASGQSVVLPDVTTCELSQRWRIFNASSGSLAINAFGSQNIVNIAPFTASILAVAQLSGTAASSWYWTNQGTVGDSPAKSPTAVGQALISSAAGVSSYQNVYPSTFRITSGSGTFSVPAGVNFIQVFLQGGGGGGQGSATSDPALLVANAGGDTIFGNSIARGGLPGGSLLSPAANNQGGITTILEDVPPSFPDPSPTSIFTLVTGAGFNVNGAFGISSRSGHGGKLQTATSPAAVGFSATGFGAGGGAASCTFGSGVAGEGGAAGGYLSFFYNAPPATFAYTVGAAGGPSSGVGAGNFAGGSGSGGLIVVAAFTV